MTVRTLWLPAACAFVMACGGGAENTATPPATESAAPAAEAHTEADANTVRIEEGMLRDLRITVDEVESRPGGEQIALLGELGVDQRAYAEVGVPVQARVTRLLVNAGQTVRRGETLAELTSPELGQARAEYLSAEARVKLADAALERKRGLAAEKIVPLREVQEAESQAAEARAALRTARASIGAFGVENMSGVLRPGMSATAVLPVGASGTPILTVPVAAVQRVRNDWCVFLPKGEGTFEIRRIGRGRDLAGEVEVLSGLRAGVQIVVDGAFLLKAQAERGEADHDAH